MAFRKLSLQFCIPDLDFLQLQSSSKIYKATADSSSTGAISTIYLYHFYILQLNQLIFQKEKKFENFIYRNMFAFYYMVDSFNEFFCILSCFFLCLPLFRQHLIHRAMSRINRNNRINHNTCNMGSQEVWLIYQSSFMLCFFCGSQMQQACKFASLFINCL